MTRSIHSKLHLVGSDGVPAQRPADDVDRTLVRLALGGSASAWQELVDRHLADVWSWSSEATGTEPEAELVNRLVWLRLAQALPWMAEPVGVWLRNAVADEASRRRPSGRRLRSLSADTVDSSGPGQTGAGPLS